jgi:hypothetical protein
MSNNFEPPPQLDLRGPDEATSTNITVYADCRSHEWIRASGITLTERDRSDQRGSWLLEVRLPKATDFEHDAAIALRMGLNGATMRMVHRGHVWIDAFVDGEDPTLFRIPEPGWNQLQGATRCGHRDCRSPGHPVVAEGRYVPAPNPTLFARLRGLRVGIVTGREP